MKAMSVWLAVLLTLPARLTAQQSHPNLASGPMNGHSAMREVILWAQTRREGEVRFRYTPQGKEEWNWSETVKTSPRNAFTAKVAVTGLEPGTRYAYEMYIDGQKAEMAWKPFFQTQELWQWRKDPPSFKVVLGSCFYVNEPAYDRPGNPYGGEFEILDAIGKQNADVMVWLGDNVYMREVDWDSRSGIFHRYSHTRAWPGLQPLLGTMHHYAIWDDHDYGPNDSDRGYVLKKDARDAFRAFWANPTFGLDGNNGITSMFKWGDMEFYLLDDRWFRAPDERTTGDRTLLGKAQFRWLIDNLKYSRAPFKFVCIGGQVLNTNREFETYVNYYPQEHDSLLSLIQREKIPGVFFLTGDRHHTELSLWKPEGGLPVYDLTVSPLTSGTHKEEKGNTLRVEGTYVSGRNFAVLEFSGKKGERVMKISVFDSQGKMMWTKDIAAGF